MVPWLLPSGLDEVAHADLTAGGGGQHGEDPEAHRVAEGVEAAGQPLSFVGVERGGEHRRAALGCFGHFDHGASSGHHGISH